MASPVGKILDVEKTVVLEIQLKLLRRIDKYLEYLLRIKEDGVCGAPVDWAMVEKDHSSIEQTISNAEEF